MPSTWPSWRSCSALLVDWERRRARDWPGRPRPPGRPQPGGAAVVFGVALANHSLTLLLGPGIALYVLAVEPGILGRRRFFSGCIAAALLTTALLYLELPLRAGIFRAPLVYGHPDTLSGFLYVVLGAQFAGSISGPLADLGGKLRRPGGDGRRPVRATRLAGPGRPAGDGRPLPALRAPDVP